MTVSPHSAAKPNSVPMKFALLIYESPQDFAARENSPETPAYWGAWQAYGKALSEAGAGSCAERHGEALQPVTTATTVRLRDGQRHVQDGPYADTKEQLGGFLILEAPSLDRALEWAARCPAAARGAVEVRPVLEMSAA